MSSRSAFSTRCFRALKRLVPAIVLGTAIAAAPSVRPADAASMPHVKLAIGGPGCLCYLPTVLSKQLGMYKKAGVDVKMISFKGGSTALAAVVGGSADVVSGYYDHTIELQAKGKTFKAFTVYDRFPGLVLVVSPKYTDKITSVKDLVGQQVGVSAPGSSTDFFLKYLLGKNGIDPNKVPVSGVGLGATAIAAMEHGLVHAAVMLDPAVTLLKNKYNNLRILSDTRSAKDTHTVFGGDYPGGSFYAYGKWISSHKDAAQRMANAMADTLAWIHSHSPKQIMAKMPAEYVGKNKALYLAALKNMLPMYSKTGMMDPKGAEAVLKVFSTSDPKIAKANIDVAATYDNSFAKAAAKQAGLLK